MHRFAVVLVVTAFASAVAASGCSSADPNGTPLDGTGYDGDASTGPTSTGGGGGGSCTNGPPPAPMDPSTLPACCVQGQMGAAHCVPTAKVPSNVASQLQTCSGGACVPDPFIKNPSLVPASCKSIGGAAGVCLSVCVPQVAQYASLLPQDSCASDEKCAPCISPLDKKPTGACDIGKSSGGGMCNGDPSPTPSSDAGATAPPPDTCPHMGPPVLDPSTLPSCDPAGGAHCLDKSLVPAAMASQLATCPTGLCVPDDFIKAGGNFIPATCRSLNDAEGRCLHEAIPQVAMQLSQLPQSTCASYERCVPCYNPLDSTATGACKLSCDPGPKEAPKPFAQCCSKNGATQGRCIPTAQIPMSEQNNLSAHECTGATLCVPSEMIPASFMPTACTGNGFLTGQYTGVCLSKCLHYGFIQQLGIDHGTCDDLHDCAPCKNPLTGQPTGAPGCPP
jgi:hypothetical protein